MSIAASHLLGTTGQTTTLSGGVAYGGDYQVLGDLVLTNGTYTLTPGTVFYVNGRATRKSLFGTPIRRVTGSTITVGDNATLVLDGATITASGSTTSCPMWRGIVLSAVGQGASGPYRLVVQNNSTISHALCGIDMERNGPHPGNEAYLIENSAFAHNITHVRDQMRHTSGTVSFITNCTFDSDPTQTRFPYEQAGGRQYYAYQALYLTPTGDTFSHTVEVSGNTISNAVYGIVNNEFDRAGVSIQNNVLNKIFQTGIWTVNNDTNAGTRLPLTSGNTVSLNGALPTNTDQIDPTATRYGIVQEGPFVLANAFIANTVTGNISPVFNNYRQVGLSISGPTSASGNLLQNVDEGISATELDGSDIADNRTAGCGSGFVVKANNNGLSQVHRLGCNTFAQGYGGVTSNTAGIVVQQNATINDIGSYSSPAANQFDGLVYGIVNDNQMASVTYYQTASSQEAPTTGGSGGTVSILTVNGLNLKNYCLGQGASNGNGVNSFRGAAPSPGYLAALMDSVRRQLVPAVRRRSYLHEVSSYYAGTQQLPILETWWATLAGPNAAAYRTLGRYLLRAYDTQRDATAAQRILAGLQPQALLDAELAAQLQLRAVLRHLPHTAPLLSPADSVTLRTLAWSGRSVAEQATRWLRYYHPRLPLPTPAPATPRLAAPVARKKTSTERDATLGAAYPNPAQTDVTITCQLPRADQAAELRFTHLLTGQVLRVVPVVGSGTERRQRVALAGLPAGQYAYQLLVEGQPATAPQKLFVNP